MRKIPVTINDPILTSSAVSLHHKLRKTRQQTSSHIIRDVYPSNVLIDHEGIA